MKEVNGIVVFDIDGVIRDVGNSYRRALADTVEEFTQGAFRPSQEDIDRLKGEGTWNNDWEASQEFIYRYFEGMGQGRSQLSLDYGEIVAFFQSRYRGRDLDNPDRWDGYISQEPLLLQATYLEQLTAAGILWGFFSGATRGSASYILERRLGLKSPLLVAMEDAPGKPNPTGLFQVLEKLAAMGDRSISQLPVIYVGDTVADMQTVEQARQAQPERTWIGVGILPPHALQPADYAAAYSQKLEQAGAAIVLSNVEQLTASQIQSLIQSLTQR
ncbi:MAG: TIGR01548 family HAD-type hydrolase [Oculatellaceae cyanobacterium Prado106]|nr:TIGR01548 family HAD-type hydrolase [Oculatellaceae cyanobacterium Prado106]